MSTASIPRPPASSPRHPTPTPGQATVAIDPLKLIQKYKWALVGAGVVGVVLGIALHFLLLYTVPVFSAQSLWECYNQEEDIGTLGSSQSFAEELEKFMATQAQLMKSDRVLDLTVTDPALERSAPNWRARFVNGGQFDAGAAAKSLQFHLSAGVIGDSNLVRLSFWDTDKNSAMAIVKLVGDVYERSRRATVTSEQAKRRDLLKKAITDTEAEVQALQDTRSALMGDHKLDTVDANASKSQDNLRVLNEQLAQVNSAIELYQNRLDQMESELESATGPTFSDDLREAANSTPEILNLKQIINQLDGEHKSMVERLGFNHQDTRVIASRLDGMRRTHDVEYERMLRRLFDSQLEQLRMGLSSARAQQLELVTKMDEQITRATELAKVREQVGDIALEINSLNKNKAEFKSDLASLQALSELDTAYRIRVVQDASLPRGVSFPKVYVMVPAGLMLVMGLVVGLIVLVEVVDQRVKGPGDLGMITRTRCLGLIPHVAEDPAAPQRPETVFRDTPQGVLAESYRQARGSILKRMDQGGHKSLVVLGGLPGSGATSVSVNLAFAAAAAEMRVLLIDANFRKPAIHRVLGIPETPGLADVLSGSATLESAAQPSGDTGVSVLTAGAPSLRAYEKVGAASMGRLLKEAEEDYDLIILDGPPAVVAEDGLAAANRADASLLVVRALSEKRGMVARLRNELAECKGEFLGVLIVAARSAAGGYLRGNIQATHRYGSAKG